MSHEILNSAPYAYLDDAPLEERRSRAVQLRRTLDPRERGLPGRAGPRGDCPGGPAGLPGPALGGRAARPLAHAGAPARAAAAVGGLAGGAARGRAGALRQRHLARRRAQRRGASGRGPRLGGHHRAHHRAGAGPQASASPAWRPELAQLENEGLVLRGRYRPGASETEWCERTLLSRIHSLTLGRLRREIEPASTQDFLRYLFRWQHVHPGTAAPRRAGARGGAGAAAGVPGGGKRVGERAARGAGGAAFDKALLDQLCLSGEVAWGRLSCADNPDDAPRRRAPPGRATPICAGGAATTCPGPGCGRAARPSRWESGRACCSRSWSSGVRSFPASWRAQTGLHAREMQEALWELVSGGARHLRRLRGAAQPAGREGAGRVWALVAPEAAGGRAAAQRPLLARPPEWLESWPRSTAPLRGGVRDQQRPLGRQRGLQRPQERPAPRRACAFPSRQAAQRREAVAGDAPAGTAPRAPPASRARAARSARAARGERAHPAAPGARAGRRAALQRLGRAAGVASRSQGRSSRRTRAMGVERPGGARRRGASSGCPRRRGGPQALAAEAELIEQRLVEARHPRREAARSPTRLPPPWNPAAGQHLREPCAPWSCVPGARAASGTDSGGSPAWRRARSRAAAPSRERVDAREQRALAPLVSLAPGR